MDNISHKKLAIIGGGVSGIISAKIALEYGVTPTIFEKNSTIGGVWSSKGHAWPDMRTNVSKYILSLPEFFWKEQNPLFPSKSNMYEFFNQFIEKFNLKSYAKTNTIIKLVKLIENNSIKIIYTENENPEEKEETFDYLIISTGNFSKPDWIGLDKYVNKELPTEIKIEHSAYYQGPEYYRGKNVMVVGHGYSGTQIAAKISYSANSVINVFRRPRWILKKTLYHPAYKKNLPIDTVVLPTREVRSSLKGLEDKVKISLINNLISGFTEQNNINSSDLFIDKDTQEWIGVAHSNDYISCVEKGLIKPVRSEIKELKEDKTVVLTNGESYNVDVILLCTGYKKEISYLDKEILDILEYNPNSKNIPLKLDKSSVYNLNLKNVAFVGYLKNDIIFPAFPFQARIAMQYFLKDDYRKYLEEINKNRTPREDYLQYEFASYVEMVADESGCLPHFDFIKKVDEELYDMVIKGPFMVHHYYLQEENYGKEKWIKAVQIIKDFNRSLTEDWSFI